MNTSLSFTILLIRIEFAHKWAKKFRGKIADNLPPSAIFIVSIRHCVGKICMVLSPPLEGALSIPNYFHYKALTEWNDASADIVDNKLPTLGRFDITHNTHIYIVITHTPQNSKLTFKGTYQ